ncbi:MAG: hypothetical protein EA001_05425 [Oscillatoriales cyanobacterium]|nr:MAG: hypothetical protein EA001_05425 [Oscillatoriales cyanobacterium]
MWSGKCGVASSNRPPRDRHLDHSGLEFEVVDRPFESYKLDPRSIELLSLGKQFRRQILHRNPIKGVLALLGYRVKPVSITEAGIAQSEIDSGRKHGYFLSFPQDLLQSSRLWLPSD